MTRSLAGKHAAPDAPPGLDGLTTEAGGEPFADYDLRPTLELVGLMRRADEAVLPAVAGVAGATTPSTSIRPNPWCGSREDA